MYSPPSGLLCRVLRAPRLRAVVVRTLAATAAAIGTLLCAPLVTASAPTGAVVLEVDGVIGPALADYVVRNLRAARSAGLVVLRMNTPGGLDTSMREIIGAILASPVPVATFVAPTGARAASAGTYIAYASAIAAMAPGTNIGAATPVQLGTPALPGAPERPIEQPEKGGTSAVHEPADAASRKAVNDAVAYIRGLAELNGRNAEWAVEAVRAAASLPASEALSLHVIDVIAVDVGDLLAKIDGRTVMLAGKPQRLATSGLEVAIRAPDWRTELLAVITNPNVAFILILIGIYGLIIEFWSPGAVAPGLVGTISLLVALYALNLLPINYAGAGLVLFGIGLMLAEAHLRAFGVLGVGGIAALVIGALLMFPSTQPEFELSPAVVAGAAVLGALLLLGVLAALLRSRGRRAITGGEALLGAEGETAAWRGGEGRVWVRGEMWRARASGPLQAGMRVKVVAREGLVLLVEKIS
jgi:membrane-bound serine protease (ClpP class)